MTSRAKIIDCAERIVLRDGVSCLTLDAVAAEASLSKGGLLYNFRTKDDLIRGMIEHLIEEYETDMQRQLEKDDNPVGRQTRAYLRATFPESRPDCERHCQVAAALLAAVLNNPALLEPVCERFRDLQQRLLNDGLDPVLVNVIRLAADGLWLGDILRLPGPPAEIRASVVQKLFDLTR